MRHRVQLVTLSGLLWISGSPAADLADHTYTSHVSPAGEIRLPQGFRQTWTHLGSWLVDDPKAPGHGFHDVYAQPEAAREFMQSGRFPDGAVLVKEIRRIGSGPMTTGPARWAADPIMWFVMVKDATGRFPGNPHWGEGWGWALFQPDKPAVNVSKGFAESCQSCHIPARESDWVFVEAYPTLRTR